MTNQTVFDFLYRKNLSRKHLFLRVVNNVNFLLKKSCFDLASSKFVLRHTRSLAWPQGRLNNIFENTDGHHCHSRSSRVPCTSDVQSSPCRHCVEHAHKQHTSCTTCVMVHIIQTLPRTVSPTARGCLVPNTESERRKAPSSSWKLASLRGRVIINFHVSLFTNGFSSPWRTRCHFRSGRTKCSHRFSCAHCTSAWTLHNIVEMSHHGVTDFREESR